MVFMTSYLLHADGSTATMNEDEGWFHLFVSAVYSTLLAFAVPCWIQMQIDAGGVPHIEGCNRLLNLSATRFLGHGGHVRAVIFRPLQWRYLADGTLSSQIIGEQQQIAADLVMALVAVGWVGFARLSRVQPPDASQGTMILEGTRLMLVSPSLVIWPGVDAVFAGHGGEPARRRPA